MIGRFSLLSAFGFAIAAVSSTQAGACCGACGAPCTAPAPVVVQAPVVVVQPSPYYVVNQGPVYGGPGIVTYPGYFDTWHRPAFYPYVSVDTYAPYAPYYPHYRHPYWR